MSTKIEDLPIPQIKEETIEMKYTKDDKQIQKSQETNTKPENNTPEKKSIITFIKNEINEENLFLLVLFFLMAISDLNKYLMRIPLVGTYFGDESWSFVIFKSFIFLFIFIIGKVYLLPKLQI